ncbi:MAG: CNP1-like family protein [Zoogloea sp.]|nr:CNP1-like family protein [Zoogloea sp.]
MKALVFIASCALTTISVAATAAFDEDDEIEGVRRGSPVSLPAVPQDKELLEFDGGVLTRNHFFVDGSSVSIQADGEVRYVLVVRTPGGGINVTYEGLRCDERRFRVYHFGRPDGAWVRARRDDWTLIENQPLNQHRKTLFRDVFCAQGTVDSPEAARQALRNSRPLANVGAQ